MVCICLQDSDVIVIGVREDNLLHCYDLSSDKLEEVSYILTQTFSVEHQTSCHDLTNHFGQTRTINLNEFGDDYVSFVPLHISFSLDGLHLLVSTGEC